MNLEQEIPQRKRAASPNKQIMMREDTGICKSEREDSLHSVPAPATNGSNGHATGVDIQDNRPAIWQHPELAPGLELKEYCAELAP